MVMFPPQLDEEVNTITYPNLTTVLSIAATYAVTSCSCEQSCSNLNMVMFLNGDINEVKYRDKLSITNSTFSNENRFPYVNHPDNCHIARMLYPMHRIKPGLNFVIFMAQKQFGCIINNSGNMKKPKDETVFIGSFDSKITSLLFTPRFPQHYSLD